MIPQILNEVGLSFPAGADEDTPGIYCILNQVSGKVYVGQSVDVRRRKHGHLYKLRGGNSGNAHLQAAFDKYGEDAFVFLLLERISPLSANILNEREKYWIARLDAASNQNGYNFMVFSVRDKLKHSPESIEKMRKSQTGIRHSEETKRKLSVTNSDGRCLAFAGSMPQEIRDKISRARTGKGIGRVVSDETRKKISRALTGKPLSETHRQACSESHVYDGYRFNKKVRQIDKNGCCVAEFFSMSEASRNTGASRSGISRCCGGKQKTAGGFRWELV